MGYIVLFLSRIFPMTIVVIGYFKFDAEITAILLLLLLLINRHLEDEDVYRIEHKVDAVFNALNTSTDLKSQYSRIHEVGWDHSGVMEIDDAAASLGKKRLDLLILITVVNNIFFYTIGCLWMYEVLIK